MAGTASLDTAPAFRLDKLPGIGRSLADKIRAAYGSDEAFRVACRCIDLDRLLAVEGLSQRRAFDIVAHVRSDWTPQLAGTERAHEVQRALADRLARLARTSYGERAIRLLPILRDPDAIRERVDRVLRMRDLAETTDREAVHAALSRLRPLKDGPKPAGLRRLIVVDDEDQEMALRSRGIDRWCRIRLREDARSEMDTDEVVLYAGSESMQELDEAGLVVRVRLDDPVECFVPEISTGFLAANRSTLEALDLLARSLGKTSAASALAALPPMSAKEVSVDEVFGEALAAARRELEAGVAALSVSGQELLELFSQGLPKALVEARDQAVHAGRRLIKTRLGVDVDPFDAGLPLQLDPEEVTRVRFELGTRGRLKAFERAREAAQAVERARPLLAAELSHWFEFDVEFALGCYALHHDARPAQTGTRLAFQGARNLRLWENVPPQAIDYSVGGAAPVTVLTGANSGGKSSLLELMLQLVILHHWGLPVPAVRAEIPVLDEVILLAGARGVDAGTFETFLRDLFPPLTRPGRRLILLDEVESMTELEAAGRILGAFLEEVVRTGSLCTLVTHLPTEVLERTTVRVRVDGIDAIGLDEKFNLLVDRQPKLNHRARSTPELILRRVHAKAQGATKDVFARVLQKWA